MSYRTLNYDFTSLDHLPRLLTCNRASAGNIIDHSGNLAGRGVNIPRLSKQGLLIEPTRVNQLTHSEDFTNAAWIKGGCSISADSVAAPDGNTTADKIVEDSSAGFHQIYRTLAVDSGATVAFSGFAKADERSIITFIVANGINSYGVTLDMSTGILTPTSTGTGSLDDYDKIILGDGWFYIYCVGSMTGITNYSIRVRVGGSYTGDGSSGLYLWGAQAELGQVTSYIQTTATTLQREPDVCSTSVLDWFNPSQGTCLCEIEVPFTTTGTAAQRLFELSDATAANRLYLAAVGASIEAHIISGSSDTATLAAAFTGGRGNIIRAAFRYASTGAAFCVNGGLIQDDDAITLPAAISRLHLGADYAGANQLGGHIRRLACWPFAVSNIQLQQLATL